MRMSNALLIITLAASSFACTQGPQNSAPPVPVATPVTAEPAAPTAPKAQVPAPAPATASAASKPPSTPAAPAAEKPSQAKAAPVKIRLLIPVGTVLPIEIETGLSSATSKEGDPVLGKLLEDVFLDGFKLDKDAEVRGAVVTAVPAKRVKGQARLVVTFNAVMEGGEKLSITTDTIDNMAKSTKDHDKKVIAGSAAGGLILGAIKDGKKGAVLGTVIGAAAGTGAVLIMKGDEVELPRGAKVTVTVTK